MYIYFQNILYITFFITQLPVCMRDWLFCKKWYWDLEIYFFLITGSSMCLGSNLSVNWIFLFSWHTKLRLLLLGIAHLKRESSFLVPDVNEKYEQAEGPRNPLLSFRQKWKPLLSFKVIIIPLSYNLWGKIVMICIMTFEVLSFQW